LRVTLGYGLGDCQSQLIPRKAIHAEPDRAALELGDASEIARSPFNTQRVRGENDPHGLCTGFGYVILNTTARCLPQCDRSSASSHGSGSSRDRIWAVPGPSVGRGEWHNKGLTGPGFDGAFRLVKDGT